MRKHTRTATAVVTAGLIAAVLSGCSDDNGGSSSSASASVSVGASPSASASASSSPSAGTGTVSSTSTPLGTILVNSKNRTVYLFAQDTTTKSTCNGGCAQAWPPVTATGTPTAGTGIKSNLLGTTTRSDGSKQVTYNGHPLYTYSGDSGSGQANGQALDAFGAKWYVLNTSGNRITTQPQNPGSGY